MELSGPEVWPRISADRQVDLFIFRRPELWYLEALRRMRAREEEVGVQPSPLMRVRVGRIKYVEKKIELVNGRSIHHTIHDDRLEDVRKLLLEIREALDLVMPSKPRHNIGAKLFFYDPRIGTTRALITFQERWI